MKANELMIGDWVRCGKRYMKVTQLAEDMDCDDINSVPLTPEILEKNGFTKDLDADGIHYWFTVIDEHIRFSILYVRSVFQWLGPLDFKYVHELQHALKLCGIKKEIEL